jgi:hypothetical protein
MNGRRAGNACSDCYLGPTSSELDLYVACLLLVAPGIRNRSTQNRRHLKLVRRADPRPNRVNQRR